MTGDRKNKTRPLFGTQILPKKTQNFARAVFAFRNFWPMFQNNPFGPITTKERIAPITVLPHMAFPPNALQACIVSVSGPNSSTNGRPGKKNGIEGTSPPMPTPIDFKNLN